jgi:hypothetical protein
MARIYAGDTPGQTNKKDIPADLVYPTTFPYNPLFEGKKKIVRKKKLEEDGVLDTASGAVGLPVSDSIGAEFGVAKSPSLIGGLVGVSSPVSGMGPAGSLYPFGTYGISESVSNERFRKDAEDHKPKHFKQLRENWEAIGGRDMGTVEKGTDEKRFDEDWQTVNRKDKTDGMSQKAVNAYRRENPGSKLKTAVTEKNPSGKRAKRRLAFCRRMGGMKKRLTSAKTARDPDSRINKALRRWNCEE